ncbi:MAG: DNA adenine methylase [Lachnospiraceae bacterium]|nr:DNA adenine methylase [Lachnospiraceae bacterium]
MAKTLIKWPGGKASEIQQFAPLIPEFDRYIEPFVGGGAVLFYLQPEKAVINDISFNLMELYELVKAQDSELCRLLQLYHTSFERLKELCEQHFEEILTMYQIYEWTDREKRDIKKLHLNRALVEEIARDSQVRTELVLDGTAFEEQILRMTEDKFRRTVVNGRKQAFTEQDRKDNLITGFTSGFYMYFRSVLNEIEAGKREVSRPYRIANFYFIREYCYGSMFRYNKKGEFNIPYGGISYNKKKLSTKISSLFCPDMARALKGTRICCMDFENFLAGLELTDRDFIFLDPPYDTEFSDYEGNSFDKTDQKRLADLLKQTKAGFLLVIKNTDYIYSLYKDHFRIMSFDNRYIYNVRSRNDRISQHLIVTNLPDPMEQMEAALEYGDGGGAGALR